MLIERLEENIAVIENNDGSHVEISRYILPKDAKEGDFLVFDGEKYAVDKKATEMARKRISKYSEMI